MKYTHKIILSLICISLLPLSSVHASINGLIYVLMVKAPNKTYFPTFEFEAGNSLIVIGASHEYGELTGTWQEAPLGNFSYFQAQVEKAETTTSTPSSTTTTATITGSAAKINMSAVQPAQSDKTKFLINLSGFSFVPPEPFQNFNMLLGVGAYLGADVIFIGFTGTTGQPQCSSVDPVSGTQGQENIQIDLVGTNTNFVEGKTTVTFSGTGISVSGVTVLDSENLSFNIDIDEFATVGARDVIVTVSNPVQSVTCAQAFTVLTKGTATTTTTP